MRSALEALSRRWWYGGGSAPERALAFVLTPLSWLWSAVTAVRNARYDRGGGRTVPGALVISVGNLAVGGTGKTPMTAWAVRSLSDRGVRAAVALRGFGADEVALHRRWLPGIPVVAEVDRVRAVERAVAEGAEVVVLDDAFQHRAVARWIDLVLLAAETPFPGRRLPCGPYREGPAALGRATGVVVTRRSATVEDARALATTVEAVRPGIVLAGAHLAPASWSDLEGGPRPAPEGDVLAVAAVARPQEFRRVLSVTLAVEVELMAFPDHHDYGEADVRRMLDVARGRTVVVTEKDAVKLERWASLLGAARVLVEEIHWDWGAAEIEALVAAAAQRVAS